MEFQNNDPLIELLYSSHNFLSNPTPENERLFKQQFNHIRSLSTLPNPTYTRMIGFGNQEQTLQYQLADAASQKLVSIHGLSGFGKTALANHVVRSISPQGFQHLPVICWMTIRPRGSITASRATGAATNIIDAQFYLEMGQRLGIEGIAKVPALQIEQILEYTATKPIILVIDNLQNDADVKNLRRLMLPLLRHIRVLYTSPQKLPTPDELEFQHVIEPMDANAAIELMRVEGKQFLNKLPDHELYDVYQLLGGYPLAIKLIAKQIEKLKSLDRVMKAIAIPQQSTPEEISDQVHEVIWRNLKDKERQVLEIIAISGVGGIHLTTLQKILKDLSTQMINGAIRHLQKISVIYSDHDQDGIRFYTHEMTTVYIDKI